MSRILLVLLIASCALTISCEDASRTSRRRYTPPRPEPKIMKVLRDVRPNRMALIVAPKAEDIEGDGQADLINVSVVLFSEPRPEPVIVPGTFEFEAVPLKNDDKPGTLKMKWQFNQDQTQAAEGPTMFGFPGYRFQLDVRKIQQGPMPAKVVNIEATFQPATGGPPINCIPDQRLVRLGNTG
ncbi:MAG: hypothetical protein VX527_11000 [Planctomycetota bacterium]|nr:hypothetical protein [Planctomycetota bacterium]